MPCSRCCATRTRPESSSRWGRVSTGGIWLRPAGRPGRTDARQGESAARAEDPAEEFVVRVGRAGQIRARMRRRLIGAAALLLGTAVVVPMMLDPAPRPLPDNIPIDIPSERTPFAPR